MEQFSVCSTSTSENEFVSETSIESQYTLPNIPVYPYVGRRPFVYNACIPQEQRNQRNRINKQKNTNCFVKAFRWYTQELPSPQNGQAVDSVKIASFATWLDKKYEQYLCDNKCQNNCLKLKQQYCIQDTDNAAERMDPNASRKTKFQRLKSPWKKNRQFANEAERRPLRETCSFKYILRPEGARRNGSQCCQKSSCCKCSDTTFTNSETAVLSKIKGKSHSAICTRFEQPVNITNYETCRSFNRDMTADTVDSYDTSKKKKEKKDFEIMKTISVKDVSCACGPKYVNQTKADQKLGTNEITHNEVPVVISAEVPGKGAKRCSHCEANVMTDTTPLYERAIFPNGVNRHTKASVSCQCSLQHFVTSDSCYCTSDSKFKFDKVGLQNWNGPCCPCPSHPEQSLVMMNETEASKGLHHIFTDTDVQTSDHSIVFDRNPVYVKMICGNEYI